MDRTPSTPPDEARALTHAEAAVLFPIRETFGKPGRPSSMEYGVAFAEAKNRADALGLRHVEHAKGVPVAVPEAGAPVAVDGFILPGLSDDDPPVSPLARWLGAVTLYYRPRNA